MSVFVHYMLEKSSQIKILDLHLSLVFWVFSSRFISLSQQIQCLYEIILF